MAKPARALFRLLPFFSVVSLLGIIIAAALATLLYRQIAIAALTNLGEQQNIGLAQSALNSVHEPLAAFLLEANTSPGVPALADGMVLVTALNTMLHDTGVVRIKVYNQKGVVVFSTKSSQIGGPQHDNPAVMAALHGQIVSKLVYHDSFNYFDQATEDDNLIQTYIPVPGDSMGSVLGVFEIYTDVNALVRDIEHMELMIIAGTGAIFLLLYLMLLAVVQSAGKIVAQQQATIAERNQILELLSAQLLDAQEKERKRVAYELHEGIAQTLAAIKFQLEGVAGAGEQRSEEVGRLVRTVQGAMQEVRAVAMQLRPPSLDDLGLGATLNWLVRQLPLICDDIQVEAEIAVREERIPPPLKVIIYRVAQDALTALTRQCAARLIRVALHENAGVLELVIDDPSLSPAVPLAPDVSLAQQRVLMSGGSFQVDPYGSRGATLRAAWDI